MRLRCRGWRVNQPHRFALGQRVWQPLWRSWRLDAAEYCRVGFANFREVAKPGAPCGKRDRQRARRQAAGMQTGQRPLHIVSSSLLQRFVTQLLEQGNASSFVAGKGLLGAARAQAGNE